MNTRITLEQLLRSRDERQAMEKRLADGHKGLTLIVLTVVVPGSVKRNGNSLVIARAGVEALREAFAGRIHLEIERDLMTGYEAFFMVDVPSGEAKNMACDIEDAHPLGRLFDIDVFDKEVHPISRTRVGRQSRPCLICGRAARLCMRERTHSYEELNDKISQLIQDYVRGI